MLVLLFCWYCGGYVGVVGGIDVLGLVVIGWCGVGKCMIGMVEMVLGVKM